MAALVTFPGGNHIIDLCEIPFDGNILKIILDSFFQSHNETDFDRWINQDILGQVYYAARYFIFDSLIDALKSYISFNAFKILLNLESPAVIFEKLYINNLLQILHDEEMFECKSAMAINDFLRRNLTSHLILFIKLIPVSFLCRILQMGLEFEDEKSTVLLYLDVYKSLDEDDQTYLKPFILRYFDTSTITIVGKQVLSLDQKDYDALNDKIPIGRLDRPLIISKLLYFRNRGFNGLDFSFDYGGHEMVFNMRVSRTDSAYLECFLYRNISKMHDCLPEFEFKISDQHERILVHRKVLKSKNYIQHAKVRIEKGQEWAHCGWSKFIKRSELKSNAEYEFSLVILKLSTFDL